MECLIKSKDKNNNNKFADANKSLVDVVNEKLRKRFEKAYLSIEKK
jgi:hypothetical protein